MKSTEFFSSAADFFQDNYENNSSFKERIKLFKHYINKYKEKISFDNKCIDLGCGPGHNSILLAEQGFSVTAIDFSEKMLSLAKQNALSKSCNNLIDYA